MPDDATPLILAVDLGTSALKIALVSEAGGIVGWESEPVPLVLSGAGAAEQSPEAWWEAWRAAAGRLLDRRPEARRRIIAVCCSTQGEGTLPVDRDGRPLGNALLWMDTRGAEPLRRQLRGWVNVGGLSLARLARFIRLTGGAPSPTGKDPAGHMLFIRDRLPRIYEQTHKFLNVLDFLNLRLTGRLVATHDSITTSWVTDNRDPDAVAYDAGLIAMLGIDRDKLPDLVPCTTVIGTLLPEVAAELGLSPATPVVAGSIDTTATAIGSGAVADFVPHLYVGTSSWLAAHVPFKKTHLATRVASLPCAVPGRHLMTALQATAGGSLTWLRDSLLFPADGRGDGGRQDFLGSLDALVEGVPPGAGGVVYAPWIWGERAPVDDPDVRAGLFNLSLATTRAEVVRAMLEGIALNTRWLFEAVGRFLDRPVPRIHIVGGGGQSDAWCQIFSDVLDVEVRQVVDPIGGNVRGAAWIAAVGLGRLSFADVPGLTRFRRVYEPRSAHRGLYDERFAAVMAVYRRLRPVYRRLRAQSSDLGVQR
jgi:xylulokinase